MKLSFKSLSLKSLSLGSTSLGSLSLQSLPETLAALSPRERRMVIFGAVALIAILIFGLLIPLDRSVAHTQQRLAKKRADLSWMQTVAPQIALLPPSAAANGESLLVIVDARPASRVWRVRSRAASPAARAISRYGWRRRRSMPSWRGWHGSRSRTASRWTRPSSRKPARPVS